MRATLVFVACSQMRLPTLCISADIDRSGSISVKELTKVFTTLLPKATDQSIIKSIVDDIMTAAGQNGSRA